MTAGYVRSDSMESRCWLSSLEAFDWMVTIFYSYFASCLRSDSARFVNGFPGCSRCC